MLQGRAVCRLCGIQLSAASASRTASSALPRIHVQDDAAGNLPGTSSTIRRPPRRPERMQSGVKLVISSVPADEWNVMKPGGLVDPYLQLSKARLTALIATTAAGGFLMSPVGFSLPLVSCLVGTSLLSASANAINQMLESPYDAQMKRTQSRLLVINKFTPLRAVGFAAISAVSGASVLWCGCNPLTASLGLLNVFLYAGVYTPLKRHHVGCTWVGAVVGAIPPLMGYAAATGGLNMSAAVIASIVYCWQFPHFNGLSWNLRGDYSRAGYRVMCVTDEKLCRTTSLRHSCALLAICSVAAPLCDLTTWTFAVDSLPLNGYLIYLAWRFYRNADSKSSRMLFFYSLLYLPLIFLFMFISKCERVTSQQRAAHARHASAQQTPLA